MEIMRFIKTTLLYMFGIVSGMLFKYLGGYDDFLKTLLIFMAFDIITGSIVAAVFKRSNKTDTGGAGFRAGFVGLLKKGCMLIVVIIAVLLDQIMHTNELTRDAVLIAFMIGELISILENMSIMGIKMPKAMSDAVELLTHKKHG